VTSAALASTSSVQLARRVISHHSKSFALASKLLPQAVRDDAAVLYAWCRRVDDAVDDAVGTPAANREVLTTLQHELDVAYGGRADDLILAAFAEVVRARQIPRTYPAELLAGMAMDLDGARYATVEDLISYAWRVAGVVGLMMTHVLGVDDEAALVPAAHLGIAMQLTNVCRDVAEDWQRDRLYIPDELLARHGAGGLMDGLGRPLPATAFVPLRGAVRDLLALADRYYRSADRGLAALPWRAAFAIRSARDIYAAIGGELARRDCDVTAPRAFVPASGKIARVMLAALRTSASAPRRIARRLAGRRHATPTRALELSDVPRA
jgi:15-cis-phytoene synthase